MDELDEAELKRFKKQFLIIFCIGMVAVFIGSALVTAYAIEGGWLDARKDIVVSSSLTIDGESFSAVGEYFIGEFNITNHGCKGINLTCVDTDWDGNSAVISLYPFYVEKTNNETGFKYLVEVDSYYLEAGETLVIWVKP